MAAEPFACAVDLARLRPLEPEADIPYVLESHPDPPSRAGGPLDRLRRGALHPRQLPDRRRPVADHAKTKASMYSDPGLWADTAGPAGRHRAGLAAGPGPGRRPGRAAVRQLGGTLNPDDYRQFVLPASTKVLGGLADLGVPRIHFGVGTGELLGLLAEAGADVVGVDWRVPLDRARQRVGPDAGRPGQLRIPAVVLAGWDVTRPRAEQAWPRGRTGPHLQPRPGVLPDTDPDVLARLVDLCHGGSTGV